MVPNRNSRNALHERYVGRAVWNRSKFVKAPGTNRRVPRQRPESEWHRNDHPRWGRPRNFSRGTCSNGLRERNEHVEVHLLAGLQQSVLQPEAMEYALLKFEAELEKELKAATGSIDLRRRRKAQIEVELSGLGEAVAVQGASDVSPAQSASAADCKDLR